MQVEKISSANAVEQIIDVFTQQLLSGELKPGDQLPPETELCGRFGVSRNTLREAIKALVAMGALEIRRPVGTFVCNGFSKPMINSLLYGIILSRGDSYDELMDLREIIETGSMLVVVRHASDEELSSLDEPLRQLKDACLQTVPQVQEVFAMDDAFHAAVMRLAHNQIVEKIGGVVREMTHDMRRESVQLMLETGRAEELYQAHDKLYRILKDRDVSGIYSEIRSTYFIPDGNKGVIRLSDK